MVVSVTVTFKTTAPAVEGTLPPVTVRAAVPPGPIGCLLVLVSSSLVGVSAV